MGKLYTDFDLSGELTENGDFALLSDESAIRQVIRNIINLNSYDIPFNNYFAANLRKYLFEFPNKIIEAEMKKSITDALLLDPRLKDPEINISYSPDKQYCYIDVTVYVVILNQNINEIITLERIR